MPERRPNVIYILSDEHRGQAMAHAGDANLRTPSMDRMADEGISFERAYANCPVCTPSRGTIFSGRHAHAGPVPGFFEAWKIGFPSIATLLKDQANYHSAYFGKWHCGTVYDQKPPAVREGGDRFPGNPCRTVEHRRAGFDDWFGFEVINRPFKTYVYKNDDVDPTPIDGYQSDVLTDLAIDYIQGYDRDEPLLMTLSIEPPHFELDAPDQWLRFDPEDLNLRPNFHDTPEHRKDLATYYAMVENLDHNIGRLMETLEAHPRFAGQNTILVYLSDHGEFVGSHGVTLRKENPHEESVRIPAIFRQPGRIPAQGFKDAGLFSLVDLVPTTLGLLGLDVPGWVQGTDFSAAVLGQDFAGPGQVLLEMVGIPRWNLSFMDWRGFVTDRWKYAFYEDGQQLLFDLQEDPYELRNLAAERPELCAQMRQKLLELLRETREPLFDVIIEHGLPRERIPQVTDVGPTPSAYVAHVEPAGPAVARETPDATQPRAGAGF